MDGALAANGRSAEQRPTLVGQWAKSGGDHDQRTNQKSLPKANWIHSVFENKFTELVVFIKDKAGAKIGFKNSGDDSATSSRFWIWPNFTLRNFALAVHMQCLPMHWSDSSVTAVYSNVMHSNAFHCNGGGRCSLIQPPGLEHLAGEDRLMKGPNRIFID